MRRVPGKFHAILLVLVAVVLLSACSGVRAGDSAQVFTVVGTEMSFDAPDRVEAGAYKVTFRNAGTEHHELAFRAPDGELVTRRSIAGGETVVMDVELTPGEWELGCFEPGHYGAGMHKPLIVEL